MIGLPRSSYYRRERTTDTAPSVADVALQESIVAIRQQHPAYGYRRVTQALRDAAVVVNRKRVQRVMRTLLAPPGPRRRPWVVAEPDAITGSWYPNLRATVVADGPNQVWVADQTYPRRLTVHWRGSLHSTPRKCAISIGVDTVNGATAWKELVREWCASPALADPTGVTFHLGLAARASDCSRSRVAVQR
jgi:HTH-like domain